MAGKPPYWLAYHTPATIPIATKSSSAESNQRNLWARRCRASGMVFGSGARSAASFAERSANEIRSVGGLTFAEGAASTGGGGSSLLAVSGLALGFSAFSSARIKARAVG